jgi:hypothetical protein
MCVITLKEEEKGRKKKSIAYHHRGLIGMGSYLQAAAASRGGGCSHGGYACREKRESSVRSSRNLFGAMPNWR